MNRTTLLTLTLSSFLCAGLAGYAHADAPDNVEPTKKKKVLTQHFCCDDIGDSNGKKSGSGCETIDQSDVKTCTLAGGHVLHCAGNWSLSPSGTASCD